jgi:hypothetical protein
VDLQACISDERYLPFNFSAEKGEMCNEHLSLSSLVFR